MRRFLWHADDLREDQLNSFFIAALIDMRASLILEDSDGIYQCVTGLPDCWTISKKARPSDTEIFGAKIAERLREAKSRARQTNLSQQIEVTLNSDHVFEFRILPFSPADAGIQLITAIIDRSEERRREMVLHSLLREVSHRSKNLLAIIQSIATQTAVHADTITSYLEKFRGRLFSLSRSQDLITESGWSGAHIRELLEHQVQPYLKDAGDRFSFEGDNVLLSPNASMHLGLAFHELMDNAGKHGTVLQMNDKIQISCWLRNAPQGRSIKVVWLEPRQKASERFPVTPEPDIKRFGSAILERVVPISVGGNAILDISPTAVRYTLDFPA